MTNVILTQKPKKSMPSSPNLSATSTPVPHIWADLIRQEHRHSELERLRAGYDGCGCSECQKFYKTIDLEKYGKRVLRFAGIITIIAGRAGADLWDKYHPPDPPAALFCPSDDEEAVTKPPAGVIIPPTENPDTKEGEVLLQKNRGGRPRKPDGETVSRMTQWRRQQEAKQGVLL